VKIEKIMQYEGFMNEIEFEDEIMEELEENSSSQIESNTIYILMKK
jgi:hypothetical protein